MAKRASVDRNQLVEMYLGGMSQRDIANAIGLSQTAIGYHLRKAGICVGKGQGMGNGGHVARTIPKKDYVVKAEAEKQEMAQKNAVNACLVVSSRCYNLKGQVAKYQVYAGENFVTIHLGPHEIMLEAKELTTFADELKAVARGLAGIQSIGPEMW